MNGLEKDWYYLRVSLKSFNYKGSDYICQYFLHTYVWRTDLYRRAYSFAIWHRAFSGQIL